MKDERELYSILLRTYNRWWVSGKIDEVPPYKRSDFYPLLKKLKTSLPLLIVGARQVGKTTLMKQLIEQLLMDGTPKENIFYVDVGDYAIKKNSDDPLLDTIKVFQQYVLKKDFNDCERTVYLFFDEIQKIKGWNEFTKNIYDSYKGKVKIVLTGSSSLSILELSEESLAGRYEKQAVVPLKFSEAYRFSRFIRALKNKESDPASIEKTVKQNDDLRLLICSMREALEDALIKKEPEIFFNAANDVSIKLNIIETDLVGFLNEYLVKGGYPEIIATAEYDRGDRLLQTYLSDIIAKDFLGKVRKPDSMELLLYILAHNTGRKVNVDRVCKDVGIEKPTYYSYLASLKKICLIYSLERLPTSLYGKQGSLPKMYLNDVGLRNSLIRKFGPFLLSENTGELTETVMCDHLIRLSFRWNNYTRPELYYWANKKEQEVDFVIKSEKFGYLPIEVKSGKIGKKRGIMSFQQEEKAPFGIVITKDRLEYIREERVILMPMVFFLLLC